jgi:hypothetical protein
MEAVVVAVVGGPLLAIVNHLLGRGDRQRAREIHSIVKGNGRGDVSKMVEDVLLWQEQHNIHHGRYEARLAARLDSFQAER